MACAAAGLAVLQGAGDGGGRAAGAVLWQSIPQLRLLHAHMAVFRFLGFLGFSLSHISDSLKKMRKGQLLSSSLQTCIASLLQTCRQRWQQCSCSQRHGRAFASTMIYTPSSHGTPSSKVHDSVQCWQASSQCDTPSHLTSIFSVSARSML